MWGAPTIPHFSASSVGREAMPLPFLQSYKGTNTVNRIYRLIWNATLKRWMVASELTRGRGKRTTRTLIAGVTLLLSLPA
ncbi:hypothetical protein DBR33_01205, partial [Stenotrophomonas sp. HMWF022]